MKKQPLVGVVFGALVISLGTVACGPAGEDDTEHAGAELAATLPSQATHEICTNDVNIRDAALNAVGSAQKGERVGVTGQKKTGLGNTFQEVVFFAPERRGQRGFVASQFLCPVSASNPGGAATGARKIVVNLTTNRGQFYRGSTLVREWNVGTARPGKVTPTGTYKLRLKQVCPPYFGADGDRNVPGCASNNPLGTRALWFIDTMYGLHGTIEPHLIANGTTPAQRRVSSGCIRNNNKDIEWLFEQVQVGDTIVVTK